MRSIIAKEVAQTVVCAEAAGGDDLAALPTSLPAGHNDDCPREEVAVADKDVVAVIADAPPTIVGNEFGHFGVTCPAFARHLDGGGVLLQAATSVA